MARGIEGRQIFNDDEDRQQFLSLLSCGIAKSGFKCYAWVLMPNHYHLLIRPNENHLYILLRSLNSKYARWFRKKNQSRGYLFQDRFKSLATQDQGYIEELVRYIHLNPIRAGICRNLMELDHFPWSGHAILVGRRSSTFQDTRTVLQHFGHDSVTAIREYRQFLQNGIDRNEKHDIVNILRMNNRDVTNRHEHRCWVVGDPEFVRAALEHDRARRLQIAKHSKDTWTVQRVVKEVARQMKIEEGEIVKRGRDNARSVFRKVTAALACRSCGIPLTDIALHYGVGSSSVSRMLDAGEEFARKMKIKIKH